MSNRRRLLIFLAACALMPLSASYAQQRAKIRRVGIIDNTPMWDPFRQGLRDAGYVNGRNIAIEYRSAEGEPDRLVKAAMELAGLPVDVIVVFGTPATRAAKQATSTIPIVAISIGDPVKVGLVASLAKPGGNMTGNSNVGPDVSSKRVQLIKEAIPHVSQLAFLWNPDNASNAVQFEEVRIAAPKVGIKLLSVPARDFNDFDGVIAAILNQRPHALLMSNDPLHQRHFERIVGALMKNRLPVISLTIENVAAGGFMSYGASQPELFRSAAVYVHKILQGARPADLPFEQPTIFELAINLKTARTLGIRIPESVLVRADKVFE
jgi:ABC-type uncharacterized transport system substrate-binding protein